MSRNNITTYITNSMFYGIFPSIAGGYFDDKALYERDRDIFKKFIPTIRNISAAGWEPIPYATVNNDKIKIERYGNITGNLYYSIRNDQSSQQNGTITISLANLGINKTVDQIEAIDIQNNNSAIFRVENQLIRINITIKPQETLVYKINTI